MVVSMWILGFFTLLFAGICCHLYKDAMKEGGDDGIGPAILALYSGSVALLTLAAFLIVMFIKLHRG